MALAALDPNVALVVIDLQKGIVGVPTVHPAQEIVSRTARIARAFRERRLPVVLVNVTGMAPGRSDTGSASIKRPEGWTELVPELEQQAGDYRVSKQRWGAFIGTPLDDILKTRKVTQIVLTGIATSKGVESTALSAYDLGYNVVIVVDAVTDRDPDEHRHCVEKIFPKLAETTTTDQLLDLL